MENVSARITSSKARKQLFLIQDLHKVSIAHFKPLAKRHKTVQSAKFNEVLSQSSNVSKVQVKVRGVKVWNKLSTEIKNGSSLATFQTLLKQSLKNQRV